MKAPDWRGWLNLFPLHPSGSLRFKYFVTGALFPLLGVLSVLSGMRPSIRSPWQSGAPDVYAGLLLAWPAIGPLLPLVGFSMISLSCWVIRPALSRWTVIRLGIYSGVPVSLGFLILIFVVSGSFTLFAALFVGPILALLVFAGSIVVARIKRFTILHLMILTLVCAVCLIPLQFPDAAESLRGALALCWIFILAATASLNVLTYLRGAISVYLQSQERNEEQSRYIPIGWLVWSMPAVAGVRWSVLLMLEEYQKLPTTNPNCYLSRAACERHAWLLPEMPESKPRCCTVSRQTKRLKFLELVVATVCPRFHRSIRRVYDRIGPPMANVCGDHRWLADVTFLVLLPAEWLAEIVRQLLRVPADAVDQLYASASRKTRDADGGQR